MSTSEAPSDSARLILGGLGREFPLQRLFGERVYSRRRCGPERRRSIRTFERPLVFAVGLQCHQ